MIKASELRIGNAIWDDTHNKIKWVTHRVISDLASHPRPLPYSPILLTPEWLGRCGFDQIESIQHNQYEVEERYTIRIDETNISYGFVAETYGGYPEKRTRFKFSNETIDTHKGVHFVHQLQNLFFALTGEELTIKM